MSDRITYRDKEIMEAVLHQEEKQVCWAISLTRHLAALLKLRGLLNMNATLSIQHLINKVGHLLFGTQRPRQWDGSIRSLETATPFLINGGSVLEHVVPLQQFNLQSSTPENLLLGEQRYKAVRIVVHRIDQYRDEKAFEADLMRCLRQSPVAACMQIFPSLQHINGNRVYRQLPDELPSGRHCMLLVKSDVDRSGIGYWEFQDSYGERRGRGGYIRLSKGVGLLTEFVEMILEEEEEEEEEETGKKRKSKSVVDASHKRAKKVDKTVSVAPRKQSKRLSQGRSGTSSTSTIRKAGSFVRKSHVHSANMGESDDDDDNIAELDASYLQTNGYLPADTTEEQISMAASSMIRSHIKEELFPVAAGNIITVTRLNKNPLNYAQVSVLADDILKNVEFDALRNVYNKFHSVVAFLPTVATVLSPENMEKESEVGGKLGELDSYEIEGGETKGEILAEFMFSCVMFNAVLENACSEMGAGMDSSSRNAGEMLDRLTLTYNRTLDASITTVPIETISGASALEAAA